MKPFTRNDLWEIIDQSDADLCESGVVFELDKDELKNALREEYSAGFWDGIYYVWLSISAVIALSIIALTFLWLTA